MKRIMLLGSVLCWSCFFSQLATADEPAAKKADTAMRKKLIESGWDQPDTEHLREHLSEIESMPFDGVTIHVIGLTDDKKPCHMRRTHDGALWKREWFEGNIRDLKACEVKHFTDNFLLTGANPATD